MRVLVCHVPLFLPHCDRCIFYHAPSARRACLLSRENRCRCRVFAVFLLHSFSAGSRNSRGRNSAQCFWSSKAISVPEKRFVCFKILLAELRFISAGSNERSKHAQKRMNGTFIEVEGKRPLPAMLLSLDVSHSSAILFAPFSTRASARVERK